MVLGLFERSGFGPEVSKEATKVNWTALLLLICRFLTPVVLLLLVIIAQLPLSLSGHSSLRLHHLFRLILTWLLLESLRCVESLEA